jgi:hypothetical protein
MFMLQEEDLAMIAAQQILVQFGPNEPLTQEKLYSLLPGYIPDYCLTSSDKALPRWANLIAQAYKKVWNFHKKFKQNNNIYLLLFRVIT